MALHLSNSSPSSLSSSAIPLPYDASGTLSFTNTTPSYSSISIASIDPANTKRASSEMFGRVEDNSAGKKLKFSPGEIPISKVLHVRNLPTDCSEQELYHIISPFGKIERIVMLRGKNQALVQMDNPSDSSNLVHYYNSVQANIRGKTVYFQFSTRSELTVPSNGASMDQSSNFDAMHSMTDSQPPNSILLITVLNILYPVTIEALHQVFSRYGNVLKIVIFEKNAGFQSLIQYSSSQEAAMAKTAMDGKNIYADCCTLRIQYSTLTNLTVKYNNDKSRDFTNPSLPAVAQSLIHSTYHPSQQLQYSQPGMLQGTTPFDASNGWSSFAALAPSPSATVSHGLPGTLYSNFPHNMFSANSAVPSSTSGPCVLIVNNLDPKEITCDALFTLFGVYGDVLRVKILQNKSDTALIQMNSTQQCQFAIQHLNSCPLHGKYLTVNFSKHNTLILSRHADSEEFAKYSKDYAGSPLHRFKSGTRNIQHIFQPSPVLHLSNLHQATTEEELCALFGQYGRVEAFKFFVDKKMALLVMDSVATAVEALIYLHNFKLHETYMRVTFSGKTKI